MHEADRYIISKNILNSLDRIPHHKIIDNIQRYIPENFPVHVAIHKITNVETNPPDYVTIHSHEVPEINILLGEKGELEYEFQLGEDVRRVTSPATVWVPSGVKHSANVRRGSGYFVCVIFSDTNSLFPDQG